MHYNITKKITVKRQALSSRLLTRFIAVLVILVAIPVIIIALLSSVLVAVFSFAYTRIRRLFVPEKPKAPTEAYYIERILLNNPYIQIIAVEDEADEELTELNEQWSAEVGNTETYLYRAKTIPRIPALEGTIICFFLKEQPAGALLQIPRQQPHQPFSTQLVFLQYTTLQLIPVEPIGPFYLYNDEKNNDLIKGFNNKEELTLYLS
ncbi:MAG: hypothetical protein INR73_27255 [Williamsia sp.]|nr:hypothetical protein [Williamsia sp.]